MSSNVRPLGIYVSGAELQNEGVARVLDNLAGRAGASASARAARQVPSSRWPFFSAWLAAAALLWWLERSKATMNDA